MILYTGIKVNLEAGDNSISIFTWPKMACELLDLHTDCR